ncbi:MAG: adenylyltransferase/cytidyltransferase family protein [bacterium]|nr:adenylyltransferase/cytidyltransferase family protein [bacterium]
MKKITSLNSIVQLSKLSKARGKKVGLVVGSFDILHMGHINLFRFAKKRADILVVGLDNDKTVKKSKGKLRPINNYKRRGEFLSELNLVDHIFQIDGVFKDGDNMSFKYFKELLEKIRPTHVFTSVRCDELWKEKKKLAKSLGIKFLAEKSKVMHTSDILRKLQSNM